MKTLYLHIGLPKTGTTAIQDFFKVNADAIRTRHAIHYPTDFLRSESCYPYLNDFTHTLRKGLFGGDANALQRYERLVAKLRDELAPLPSDHSVLISSEDLSQPLEYVECMQRLIADMGCSFETVKVIVYLRRQDTVLPSFVAQKMKSDSSLAFASMDEAAAIMPSLRLGYDRLCAGLADAFGRENIIVRPYARSEFPGGDVTADFLRILGIPGLEGFAPVPKSISNPSLPLELALFRRLLNPILMANGKRNFFMLPEKSLGEFPTKRKIDELFAPVERAAFVARFAEGNAAVAREWLNREDGVLFPEKLPDPNAPYLPYPGCTNAELLAVFDAMVRDVPYKALWILGRIEAALNAFDPVVAEAAKSLRILLKRQRFPWSLWISKQLGIKVLGLYKLPVCKQMLQWFLSKPVAE